ncbi:MAG: sugar-binding domain-containing protein [Micropruina sp.]|uniref:sugar-binding domain-containing protein n=1 Tax=Micropruina sp. TaxID=2737536 RepID=UPI0039E6CBE5
MEPTGVREMRRHERRLREVAELYWVERCSQADIAEQQSISRATVSRMLEEARERGIVRFHLADAHDRMPELEEALRARWSAAGRGVRFRVALQFKRNLAEDDYVLGRVATRAMAAELRARDRRTVAVASSRTMAPVVPFAESLGPLERVSELLGVSTRSASAPVGEQLAVATGAGYDAIASPFVHREVERAQAARRSVELAGALGRARRASVALVGANSTQRFDGTGGYSPVPSGLLAEGAERGAVGHVCGWFLDAAGARVPSSLDELRVGIEPSEFVTIPHRVLLAWGVAKAPIIAAAVAAGLCTTVVTDATTARALLDPVSSAG